MEDYFSNFKYEEENLFKNYHDNYEKQLKLLIYSSNKSDDVLYKEVLNSFEIIAIKTGESINKFKYNYDTQKENESVYFSFFESLKHFLTKQTFKKEDIDKLNRIFLLISKQPKLSLFKVKFYTSLLRKLINEGILNDYDTNSLNDLINTMKLDLNLYQIVKEKDTNPLYEDINDIYSSWRFTIEDFFSFFSNEVIIKNIHLIQEYYE